MITVHWTCDDGRHGTLDLTGDDRWSIGRGGGQDGPSVVVDHPMVSRVALVVRDTGVGPVVFRGQRENGARVTIEGPDGSEKWLDEGTAGNLEAGSNRVELVVRDVVVAKLRIEVAPRVAEEASADISA